MGFCRRMNQHFANVVHQQADYCQILANKKGSQCF
jgi:hypothetical protein